MTAPQSCTKGFFYNFRWELGLLEIILKRKKPHLLPQRRGMIGSFINSSGTFKERVIMGNKNNTEGLKKQ
jgi:hypothetical protein